MIRRSGYRIRIERIGDGVDMNWVGAMVVICSKELRLSNYYLFAIIENMREHSYLGEFELMLLLTILRLGEEAYGVPLARGLTTVRGGEVALGSVYAALDRLEMKGLVTSRLGEATPERGGRAKRYFRVTEEGLRSIHATRKVLTSLWRTLPSLGKEPA